MDHLAPLILDLTIILCVAGLVTLLFQKIRQPIVLGYLISGIIIGPYTPPHALVTDIPNIKILSELGIIFLMFFLGLDFSFQKLTRVGLSASITGLFEVVLMMLLGFATGKLLGWSFYDAIFLGAALAISSTTIIIKAIDELGLLKKRFAELMFGILIVEDLIAILLLVLLTSFVTSKSLVWTDIAHSLLQLVLVVGAWFILGYFLIPPFLKKIMRYANDETMTVVSIGLCLFLVSIAAYFDYSIALGAFIMGSILAETPLVHHIERLIRPIKDIFAAIFFVSVGMLVNPETLIQAWPAVLAITLVTLFGKTLVTSIGALVSGQSLNTALRVGFGMAQVGEFSFIIAGVGLALHATSSTLYPIIVAVSCITTFTTPYLIRASGHGVTYLDAHLPPRIKYVLELYATRFYRLASEQSAHGLIKKTCTRLLINGIVIAIIFTLVYKLVLPQAITIIPQVLWAKMLCWLLALLLSAPFLWGMLWALPTPKAPSAKKPLSVSFIGIILMLITLSEFASLSISYVHNTLMLLALLLLLGGLLLVFHRPLATIYHWLEHNLLKNIDRRQLDSLEQVKFWELHPVELLVNVDSDLAHKTLAETRIRQNFGVNIIALFRNLNIIITPNGQERLLPYDKVVALGTDAQIDALRSSLESLKNAPAPTHAIKNFRLKTLLIDAGHPLKGSTIKAAGLHKQFQGLVVGIERHETRIVNPSSDMRLEEGDLLFIYGV